MNWCQASLFEIAFEGLAFGAPSTGLWALGTKPESGFVSSRPLLPLLCPGAKVISPF
jgi:hypothetical protein